MNCVGNLQALKRALVFARTAGVLLVSVNVAAQSVTAHVQQMISMHSHHPHSQARMSAARPSMDEPGGSSFTFTSIDVPGAIATIAGGINARGEVVGVYFDAQGNSHGFVLNNGLFSSIDVPGSIVGVSGTLQSEANGINAAGNVVGDYFAPPGAPGAPECLVAFSPACRRGYLDSNGKFSDVLVPGKKGSIPNAISPDGTIYGCDHDDDYMGSMFGFARMGLSSFITLSEAGGELADATQSVPASMNNGGTPDGTIIVGLYVDPPNSGGQPRGYIVQNGQFRPYDVPGSTATQIWGINASADFVGLYDDSDGNEHGFLQKWGPFAPVTIDVPSAAPFNSVLTDAFGINPAGAIVGLYIDAAGNFHGYLAMPKNTPQ